MGILEFVYRRRGEKRKIARDRLQVYGQLSAIALKIEQESPRSGIMMMRIAGGPLLFRVPDDIVKELENIMQTKRYLLEDSTWKAWEERIKGPIHYGHGDPQHDLGLELFIADVKKHFELLKSESPK